MRVALVMAQLRLGGSEKQATLLAGGLRAAGVDSLVVCLNPAGPRAAALRDRGVEFTGVSGGRLQRLFALGRLLASFKPDIVHGFDGHASMYARFSAQAVRNAVVVGGVRFSGPPPLGLLAFERLTCRMVHGFVANSRAGGEMWARSVGCPPERIFVIPNGIDPALPIADPEGGLHQLIGARPEQPIVGCIASVYSHKGPDTFLNAACAVTRAGFDAHFVWIGEGPQRAHMQQRARDLGLDDRVHFIGSRLDAVSLARDFSVGVLPSVNEGMPNAVMEYMCCGVPVVASRVGAIDEMIGGDTAGYTVMPGDSEAFAHAISRLLRNPIAARELGARGRARVLSEYSVTAMIQNTLMVYERIASLSTFESRHKSRTGFAP